MKIVWVLALMLLFSCQDIKKVDRPNDLIPEQKMVEVLTDLSLINSAKNYNRRLLEETGLRPSEFLYQKHNIDSLQLARSTEYYASNPEQIERIYKQLQDNLEDMRDKLEIVTEEEKRIKDSLQLINKGYDSLKTDSPVLQENIDSLGASRESELEYQN